MKKPDQLPIQPCSTQELEEALEVLEGRWKILILFHLFSAPDMVRYRRGFDLWVNLLASKDFWASSTAAECLLVH